MQRSERWHIPLPMPYVRLQRRVGQRQSRDTTRGTDFFWLYENGKRVALRLISGNLMHHRRTSGSFPSERNHRTVAKPCAEYVLAFLVLAICRVCVCSEAVITRSITR